MQAADSAIPRALSPSEEAERLAALHGLAILDTEPDEAYTALSRLAATICETPMAAVTLVDEDRLWYRAAVGLELTEVARRDAFCSHTILGSDPMVVGDALDDARFAQNPLVLGDPHIRFYAGVPLHDDAGHALGSLCVIDRTPRRLTDGQMQALRDLATQVEVQLSLRRTSAMLTHTAAELETRITEGQRLNVMTRRLASLQNRSDVLQVILRTSGELSGESLALPSRAQVFYVTDGNARLAVETDDTGETAVGLEFPIADHPYMQRAIGSGRIVTSAIDLSRMGPSVAPAIERLNLVGATWLPLGPGSGGAEELVVISYRDPAALDHVRESWLEALGPIARIALDNALRLEQMSTQARHDGLTGLANRRAFDEALVALPRMPYAIVAVDADHLKQLNDTRGHAAGDRLIIEIGAALSAEARVGDLAARVGGDEFAVLMIGADETATAALIARLRAHLERPGGDRPISVSAGAAAGCPGDSATEVWRLADQRLYEDKRERQSGRAVSDG